MTGPIPAVTCTELGFAWPDGPSVFAGLTTTFGAGRSGLVGVNGSGKSTLLRLIAGDLRPGGGVVTVHGELGYQRQDLMLAVDARVEDALGIAGTRAAVQAIETGEVRAEHFATVGDDWDVDARAHATLATLGLGKVSLDQRIGELSGGEGVLVGLAGQLLRRPDVLLLDEPTNNLDTVARARLYHEVTAWRGALIVVTHDRELLDLVDQIGDLRDGDVHWYGGSWDHYTSAIDAEQQTARRLVRAAEQDVRRQRKELAEARVKLDRRVRYGQKMWDTKREPKVVMGERKRQAQVAAGKHRVMHQAKVDEAQEQLSESEQALHDDREIRIDLPRTTVPAGRQVLSLQAVRTRCHAACDLHIRGPERIALLGHNGAGKTTLLDTIAGRLPPLGGSVQVDVPLRYLPQRLDVLDPAESVAQNTARFAPDASDNDVRASLARFLFRGRTADQPVRTLSGGQRFRATLAALLLADPPPQLLLLDEPTNNLDLPSAQALLAALRAHRGALLIASHDHAFLREIRLTRWLHLSDTLADVEPP